MEIANCPPNAFAIRSSVATEGFAMPLSILEISNLTLFLNILVVLIIP